MSCAERCRAQLRRKSSHGSLQHPPGEWQVSANPFFPIGSRCDKCKADAVVEVECTEKDRRGDICGNAYRRCAEHGGEAGARRSLKSHKGVYHPKTGGES